MGYIMKDISQRPGKKLKRIITQSSPASNSHHCVVQESVDLSLILTNFFEYYSVTKNQNLVGR